MAGIKIIALPAAPSAQLTDVFPVSQSLVTYKESNAQLLTLFQANGAALTSANDTNVTLTLSGSPSTALLNAAALTLGWTGTLSPARGGTGVNNGANALTLGGSLTTSGAFASAFTMTGATNVTFPTSGTLATTAQIPSFIWNDVASSPQALSVSQGYITDNGASLVTYTLPAIAAIGSVIEISGKSAGGWIITYGTNQIIHIGNQSTTITSGSLASSNQWDYVKLLCVTANLVWNVIGGVGNFTII